MTETDVPEVVAAARHLREIVSLYGRLEDQAAADALRGDAGRSEAMMELGAVGNAEAAKNRFEAAEAAHYADPERVPYPEHIADWTDDGSEPVLATLAYWSDWIRLDRDEVTDLLATVNREADYLRSVIDWAKQEMLEWPKFLDDLSAAQRRLENLVRAGIRKERGVPCMYDECHGARLTRTIDDKGER